MNNKNFKLSAFLYTLGSILTASVSFIFLPLFMKEFTVPEFGVYSLILVLNAVAGAIFYFGVTSALVRSFFDYSEEVDRLNCFYTTLVLLAIGGFLQVTFAYYFSSNLSILLFNSSIYSIEIFIGLISSAILFINYAFLTFYRLSNKPYNFFVCSSVTVILNTIFMYYFVVEANEGILGALKAPLVSQLLILAYFIFFHFNLLKKSKFSKFEATTQLKFGVQHVLSSLCGMSILWVDQFFINKYLSLSEVGTYALAIKLAAIITVSFSTPFIQVFNPIAMEQRTDSKADILINKSFEFYMLFGFLLVMLISFLSEEFIYVFDKNNNYTDSILYIMPLMISALIYGVINIISIGLHFERKLVYQTYVFFVFTFVNILLNYLLIPSLKVWGAVLSTFFTYFLMSIVLGYVSFLFFKVKYSLKFMTFLFTISIFIVYVNVNYITVSDIETRLLYKLIIFTFVFCYLFNSKRVKYFISFL